MSYPPAGNPPPPIPTPPGQPASAPHASTGDAPLQFDRAEYGATPQQQPPVTTCAACQERITGTYYAAGEHVLCPPCRDQILASMTGGSAAARFLRAAGFGIGAGIVGAVIWYAITKLTGYEIGLIAVAVGYVVGMAVRKGSNHRGGVGYQILAVVITYCCIVSSYVPDIYAHASKEPGEAPAAFLLAFSIVIAFIAPVLAGFQNIFGILIIGIALWEAWRINKYQPVQFTGPFSIADPGGAVTTPTSRPPSSMPPPPVPPDAPPPPPPQLGMT